MRATTIVVALGLVVTTAGATTSLGGTDVTERPLESQITDVRTDASPEGTRMFTFVGETAYTGEGPVNPTSAVSDTSTLEPADVPGVDDETPYQWLFRAAPTVRGDHGTTIEPGAGFTHHAWYYGGLAEGSYVKAGESMDNLVGVNAPTPLFPPREVTSNGELAWEDVADLTYDLETTEWDPENGVWETATSTATGFAAVLRVDGGGLVAEQDVTSPELRIPISDGDFVGAATTLRPTDLPGIDYDIDTGFVDDPDGGESYKVQVTVEEGSRWPESGDEAPGGTWKLVIRGVAITFPDSETHEELDNQGGIQVALGAIPPGSQAQIETTDGRTETLPTSAGLGFEATPDTVEVLEHTPWPKPSEQRTEPLSERTVSQAGEDCGDEYASTAHADLQAAGDLTFDLEASSGTVAEDVCIRGTPVGSFGLPSVEVDGQVYSADLVGEEPQVRERHYMTSEGYGSQFVLTFLAEAGPITYTALLPLDADESGSGFLLRIQDFHALDEQRHEIRFVWAMDADAGPDETFLAYDEAPMRTEGIVPEPGPGAALALGSQQHTVVSEQTGVQHTFEASTPADLTVFAADGLEALLPAPAALPPLPPEAHAAPPEPMVDSDVAFLVPHPMEGAYQGWLTNRGNLVDRGLSEVPLGGGALANAGFLIANAYAGQLGFSGFHVVDNV